MIFASVLPNRLFPCAGAFFFFSAFSLFFRSFLFSDIAVSTVVLTVFSTGLSTLSCSVFLLFSSLLSIFLSPYFPKLLRSPACSYPCFSHLYPCPQTTFKYLGSAGLISNFSRKCRICTATVFSLPRGRSFQILV